MAIFQQRYTRWDGIAQISAVQQMFKLRATGRATMDHATETESSIIEIRNIILRRKTVLDMNNVEYAPLVPAGVLCFTVHQWYTWWV